MRQTTERMFIAVWADELSGPIERLQRRLKAADANVRWVAPDQLHLTVKFLGDTTLLQTPAVCRAMKQVASHHAPLELELVGANAFPHIERPRTLWLAVTAGAEQLRDLHLELDEALADLRFPRESRFTAHLTIGRVRSQRNTAELHRLLAAESECEIGKLQTDEISLISSRMEAEGPIYETVGRATLGDPKNSS